MNTSNKISQNFDALSELAGTQVSSSPNGHISGIISIHLFDQRTTTEPLANIIE